MQLNILCLDLVQIFSVLLQFCIALVIWYGWIQNWLFTNDLFHGCFFNFVWQIIWVEQAEYDESSIRPLYRPLLRSGMGFGAQRWMANWQSFKGNVSFWQPLCHLRDFMKIIQVICDPFILLTECNYIIEFWYTFMNSSYITPTGRTSMAKLAQRMTRNEKEESSDIASKLMAFSCIFSY